ncbi:MAG: hypothetical protein JF615_17400 [Asticcacaulis sp.]|nr:hypothetical protein [Asticcacaulis sp.]
MENYFADIDKVGADKIRLRFGRRTPALRSLSTRQIHELWATDSDFCWLFSRTLADLPFDAFFWETPPLRQETIDGPFECMLTSASGLALQRSDSSAFASRLSACPADSGAIVFDNLGGDATLVVPVGRYEVTDYCHLASFLRTGNADQINDVWRLVGRTAEARIAGGETCWISTSGLGVPWLHIRVDARPKYYSHAPYRMIRD